MRCIVKSGKLIHVSHVATTKPLKLKVLWRKIFSLSELLS